MPSYAPKGRGAVAALKSPRIPRTLTDAERRRMRDAVEAGQTYREVARRFGVSVTCVVATLRSESPGSALPVELAASSTADDGSAP